MNIIQKALRRFFNPVLSELYTFMGYRTPVWLTHDVETLTRDGYYGNADVYSIINRIIVMGSPIPLVVQTFDKGRKAKDLPEHEMQLLLENPNPFMSGQEFMAQMIGFYALQGECMALKVGPDSGSNAGKPQELWIMPPHLYNVVVGNEFEPVIGYTHISFPDRIIPASQVIHIKNFTPEYGGGIELRGSSPLRAASRLITLGNAAVEANATSFLNGGLKGILSREGGKDAEFTAEQGTDIRKRLFASAEESRGIAITGGDVKWQAIGLSPVDMNILSREQYNRGQLCNIWHMPSELFNDDAASTYNNMVEIHKAAYVHGVLPIVNAIVGGYNNNLASVYGKGIWLKADTSNIEVLQTNKKELVEWLKAAYWIPVDKKQEMMGMEVDTALKGIYCDPNGKKLSFDDDELDQEPDALEQAAQQLGKWGVDDYGLAKRTNGKH